MIDSTLEFLPVTDTEMHFDIDEFWVEIPAGVEKDTD